MRFLLIAGLAESLLNFRGPLIAALQACGLQVHVAAPDLPLEHTTRLQLEARGLTVHTHPAPPLIAAKKAVPLAVQYKAMNR